MSPDTKQKIAEFTIVGILVLIIAGLVLYTTV